MVNLFKNLFGSKEPKSETFVLARLNARAQPLDRGDIYEDPLQEVLAAEGIGEVTGGGTQFTPEEGIEYCDVDISVNEASKATLDRIVALLEQFGAPKGSNC